MDNNWGDEQLIEQQTKPVAEEMARDLYDLKKTYDGENDVKAINERIKPDNDGYGPRKTDEDYGKSSKKKGKKGSSLEDKDELGSDDEGLDGEKKKEKSEYDDDNGGKSSDDSSSEYDEATSDDEKSEDSVNEKGEEKDSESKDKKKGKKGKGSFKKKLLYLLWKYKKYVLLIGLPLLIFIIVFVFTAIMAAIDSFLTSITNFFGVAEVNYDDGDIQAEGLYDSDEYLYNENGDEMTHEELVEKLKSSDRCKANFLTSIGDFFEGGNFRDECSFLRYIQNESKGKDVDMGLVISTIFYGYEYQPSYSQYDTGVTPEEQTSSADHFESLSRIITDKNSSDFINKENVKKIIKYSISSKTEFYYTWIIEEKKDDQGKVTKLVGKCERKESTKEEFNISKWEVFMRFGETAANKFDEATLKVKSFTSSSEECRSNVTDAELLEKVNAALTDENKANGVTAELDSTSIEAARKDLDVVDETYSSPFYQFADIETKTLDVFNNFGSITFDYANGFAYRHFPAFEKAINNPSINISYDSIFTPKEVERAIQEIENRKSDLNDVLFLEDKGVPEVYTPTDPGEVGIITGAHCGNYLTAKLSEIKVRLTDCNGRYLDTVPFDDYIIGVANGEVSHRSDDYVLSEMLAALSYALKRHNNYTKGDIITMRSGTCDQVYCNPKKGCTNINDVVPGCSACHSYTIGGSRGYYPSIYPIYQALYEKASQYLVVSNGTPHNCHYVSTVQNRWNEKANRGMPFTQIIAEEYASEGAQVVKCSDLEGPENEELPEEPETKIGHEATADYPEVSPDKGPFYGFAYKNESNGVNITIIPEWKTANLTTIKPKCSVSEFANMSFTVHAKAVKNYEKAFEGICTLLTTGVTLSDGSTCKFTMDDLKDGTAFIERKNAGGSFDLHPYGLSQDWNYSKTYTISGKTYKPYNTRELSDYLDFVNAIGGKEENCQNVNYILYLKAYKDAGFKWGGNYGRNGNSGSFDGKLFELVYTEG